MMLRKQIADGSSCVTAINSSSHSSNAAVIVLLSARATCAALMLQALMLMACRPCRRPGNPPRQEQRSLTGRTDQQQRIRRQMMSGTLIAASGTGTEPAHGSTKRNDTESGIASESVNRTATGTRGLLLDFTPGVNRACWLLSVITVHAVYSIA